MLKKIKNNIVQTQKQQQTSSHWRLRRETAVIDLSLSIQHVSADSA